MRRRIRPVLWLCTALALACGDGTGPSGDGAVVSLTQPREGATDASVAGAIHLAFARAVTLPSDTSKLFWLERNGVAVAGLVSRPDSRTLMLQPYEILDPATRYVLHLREGITDAAGNSVAAATWTFTTRGEPLPLLDADRTLAHVSVLAHDSMRGRGSGTADEVRAANYVQQQFQSFGLTPYATGQWRQSFTYGSASSSQNVVGMLTGEGTLKSEWVVVGAHYDHIGVSATTGLIRNGADDNASGTAAMLEIARTLSRMATQGTFGSPNRRSFLFMAFGAEEAGLLGSNYFCAHPLVPLASVVGMVNLDMVGRLRNNTLITYAQGTALEWPILLSRYNTTGLTLTFGTGDVGTDYRCFKNNGRPAIALYTGTHPEYHQPTDDVALINSVGMAVVGTLGLDLAIDLALRPRLLTPPATPDR